MDKLSNKRVPLAWFLLSIIAAGVSAIVWLAITNGSQPANAVLIHNVDDQTSSSTPIAQFGQNVLKVQSSTSQTPSPIAGQAQGKEESIAVYVSGAVNKPGVYSIMPGARVADAVDAAGGARSDADLQAVNLAARVRDEEHISIPVLGSTPSAAGGAGQITNDIGTVPPPTSTSHLPTAPKTKLDLNSATTKELEGLPEIGPVLAARIVAYRDQNGPFSSVDDLKRISGIKDAVLGRLREYVTVSP